MAPNTPEVLAHLEKSAIKIANSKGYTSGTKEFCDFVKSYIDPRNVPPMVIEDAITNTAGVAGKTAGTMVYETLDVKVIVNEFGDVVTVIPK
jgi:hypothetical protein